MKATGIITRIQLQLADDLARLQSNPRSKARVLISFKPGIMLLIWILLM